MTTPAPSFPLQYPDGLWTCPVTDACPVPKTIAANLEYRDRLLSKAQSDTQLQADLIAVCTKSPLYWMNTFAWAYRPKMICADGIERSAGITWTDERGIKQIVPPADQPVLTWPAQDHFVTELVDSMRQGGMALVPKSREQGATLLLMLVCTWGLLFWERFSALCISRREDLVENLTEDSLLGKTHYALSKLPPWMMPGKITRTVRPIKTVCEARGSMILGESANIDVGQSRRVNLVVVDEAARFPHGGGTLLKSIASVGACTVLASTPAGPGTVFSKMCLKQTTEPSDRVKMLTLSYADSPTHGSGREWVIDEDGTITGTVGAGYWETPAFKLAREQTPSPRDWRENWLIGHDTSGLLVLNSTALGRLREGVRAPRIGRLVEGDTGLTAFVEHDRGRLFLWEEPRTDTNYVIGCDFGQGVEQANTVLAVMDRGTGVVVAEYVDPAIDAWECVPIAWELGEWYGGDCGLALVVHEANGPGVGFGREMEKQVYWRLYRQRAEQSRGVKGKSTKQTGWVSTPARKEIAFSQLNKALCSGEFVTYSEAGIDDMAAWLYDEHGRIVCGKHRDETTGAQARHGDRAIAYMLCVKGRDYTYDPPAPVVPRVKPGTFAAILGHDAVWGRIRSGRAGMDWMDRGYFRS
jgi:hypothetical protein